MVYDTRRGRQLLLEVVVVALALAAALAGVAWAWPAALRGVRGAALAGLALGAALHLGFEATGLNGAYCSVGHACTA